MTDKIANDIRREERNKFAAKKAFELNVIDYRNGEYIYSSDGNAQNMNKYLDITTTKSFLNLYQGILKYYIREPGTMIDLVRYLIEKTDPKVFKLSSRLIWKIVISKALWVGINKGKKQSAENIMEFFIEENKFGITSKKWTESLKKSY